ncbi:hypothetical protein MPTK1_5g14200 [Marchantia polymorpha subsp. ruderalis]|uniref:Uncharacterized protein n=2 Tax=Marchantia polymorpha TaxID=3197 RepID=A0AAF6BI86_MARPO|nr:hypothetical protein MARPO_0032s0112 [Marchantia polymorpha]BBN11720.1 hypothetical protein Mp_5g14200 [Marchantia polymorpha subsp. ruderalis]|eukprot:PTQ41937.1 hypothetical protein MARPO_0032s0112 [Marchantia polymorpha]
MGCVWYTTSPERWQLELLRQVEELKIRSSTSPSRQIFSSLTNKQIQEHHFVSFVELSTTFVNFTFFTFMNNYAPSKSSQRMLLAKQYSYETFFKELFT